MSEIPLEIAMHAERLYDEGGYESVPTIIAKAIIAERNRCAEIADSYECYLADYGGSVDAEHFYQGGVIDAGAGIAKAILGGTPGTS